MNELFEEIQAYLKDIRERSDEARELECEQLLEEFYQTPSYFERFKREKQEDEQ